MGIYSYIHVLPVNANKDRKDNSIKEKLLCLDESNMADNECCSVQGKITRAGFCVCCAGPDMQLMEGVFLSANFIVFLFITPPARRAWRSYKFAPLDFSVFFFFSVSKVGLPLMGYTAVQYTDCYLSPCQQDF